MSLTLVDLELAKKIIENLVVKFLRYIRLKNKAKQRKEQFSDQN